MKIVHNAARPVKANVRTMFSYCNKSTTESFFRVNTTRRKRDHRRREMFKLISTARERAIIVVQDKVGLRTRTMP